MATNLCYKQLFISFRNAYNQNMIHFPHFQSLLHFSSTQSENPTPQNPSISDYLVNSCGFSPDKALNISSHLTRLNLRPKKPDSVLNFLREKGFNDTHIRIIITGKPRLLSARVDKTLLPKIQFLEDLGFSGSTLVGLIVSNPNVLFRSVDKHLLPSVDFLRAFLTTHDMVIKAIKGSSWLLTCDLKKCMASNIRFLRNRGASDEAIANFVYRGSKCLLQSTDRFEWIIERIEKLGFEVNSMMFVYAALVIGKMNESTLEAKFEILRSFGWSETDIQSAFRRNPKYLEFSEAKIRRFMDFLLNIVGCDHSYVVTRPKVLMFSLGKRVIPRYNVMQTLKSKGLIDRIPQLNTFLGTNEERFLKSYVIRHLKSVPDLQEVYMDGKKSLIC